MTGFQPSKGTLKEEKNKQKNKQQQQKLEIMQIVLSLFLPSYKRYNHGNNSVSSCIKLHICILFHHKSKLEQLQISLFVLRTLVRSLTSI